MDKEYKNKNNKFKQSLEVPDFMKKPNTQKSKANIEERYTAPKGTLNKTKKRKINKKKLIIVLGATGLMAFGGLKAYDMYKETQKQNAPITLDQAIENGDSLKKLGIDEKIKTEIDGINKLLSSDEISNKALIDLASRINNLQFDTIKTKLANTLGVEETDISLYTESADEGRTRESVYVKDGETYRNKEFLVNSNTITSDIADYIKDIAEMQTLMGKIQNQNIDRSDILKKYKSAMETVNEFAAGKMDIDEKGNISMDYTKVSELYTTETKETKGKVASSSYKISPQIEDDEMEL